MFTIEDPKKGIQQVIDYLVENERVWNESRNLKLYDVFYHASDIISEYPYIMADDTERENVFYWFCNDTYEQFLEWMKEEKITDCRKYIGRTSSFYLTDLYSDNINEVIEKLIDANYIMNGIEWSIHNGVIDIDIYDEEEAADLNYLSTDFLSDVKSYIYDAMRIADYIDDTKEHQVEYFKDYLFIRNCTLEYDYEKEVKKEQDFTAKYKQIIDTVVVNIEKTMQETEIAMQDIRHIFNTAAEQVETV